MTTPLIEKFGARWVVFGSTLVTAAAIAMLRLDGSVLWFWLSTAVMGIAMGVSYPALSTFVIACLPRERYGPGMGMQRSFGDIGFVFGPVLAGLLDDYAGPGHSAVIWMNVALLISASLLFALGSGGMRGERGSAPL